ncbi:MAG: DUF6174 domain-containing protein [Spirochaetaceae bacterium]|jgi:hypothetical protein|nr:DUF6174 domain-containing protein [Spirochaetaceae bacterium]
MGNFLKGFVFTIIVVLFSSCDGLGLVTTRVTVEFDYAKFNTERASWNLNPPLNYQYNLEYRGGGELGTVDSLIFVKDGKYERQEPKYYEESRFYLTITDIYNEINESYVRYNDTLQFKDENYLKKIVIRYDKTNHIPLEIEEYYHVPMGVADVTSYSHTIITQYKTD